jgi:hypothetical protein
MTNRPTSITVIAWILIGMGALGLLQVPLLTNDPRHQEYLAKIPVPIPIQYAITIGGAIADVVCGYFMLRGRNWSRYVFVVSSVIVFAFALATSPIKIVMIPGMIGLLVIMYFLFRPPASAFFAMGGAEVGMPSTRRVISICCYVVAGLFFSVTCSMAFIGSPGELAKWFILGFALLPASVFLSIGRALSREPRWAREVGIVLVSAAAVGALMVLMMALTFMEQQSQKAVDAKGTPSGDYTTGVAWIALMGALGGFAILATRKQQEPGSQTCGRPRGKSDGPPAAKPGI